MDDVWAWIWSYVQMAFIGAVWLCIAAVIVAGFENVFFRFFPRPALSQDPPPPQQF